MGVIIPVSGSQATVRWQLSTDAEPMVCTIGFVDDLLTNDPVAIANRFNTAWDNAQIDSAADMLVGYSKLTKLVTTRLASGPVTVEVGAVVTGTQVGNPLPNNCSFLVRKISALGGRRNRGRLFVPPFRFGEDTVAGNGTITAAQVSAMQGEWTAFLTQMNLVDLTPVIWHSDGSPGPEITSMLVQPRIATQRTRMRP